MPIFKMIYQAEKLSQSLRRTVVGLTGLQKRLFFARPKKFNFLGRGKFKSPLFVALAAIVATQFPITGPDDDGSAPLVREQVGTPESKQDTGISMVVPQGVDPTCQENGSAQPEAVKPVESEGFIPSIEEPDKRCESISDTLGPAGGASSTNQNESSSVARMEQDSDKQSAPNGSAPNGSVPNGSAPEPTPGEMENTNASHPDSTSSTSNVAFDPTGLGQHAAQTMGSTRGRQNTGQSIGPSRGCQNTMGHTRARQHTGDNRLGHNAVQSNHATRQTMRPAAYPGEISAPAPKGTPPFPGRTATVVKQRGTQKTIHTVSESNPPRTRTTVQPRPRQRRPPAPTPSMSGNITPESVLDTSASSTSTEQSDSTNKPETSVTDRPVVPTPSIVPIAPVVPAGPVVPTASPVVPNLATAAQLIISTVPQGPPPPVPPRPPPSLPREALSTPPPSPRPRSQSSPRLFERVAPDTSDSPARSQSATPPPRPRPPSVKPRPTSGSIIANIG